MTGNYSYRSVNGETTLCREDAKPLLLRTKKLVFDCDGVIVSDINSYREAIVRSVDYYFLRLLGLKGEERHLVNKEDIQRLKDTGAFNNDWKLTYALIIYYLGLILSRLQKGVKLQADAGLGEGPRSALKDLLRRLESLGEKSNSSGLDITYLERMKSDPSLGFSQLVETFTEDADLEILKGVSEILGLNTAMLEAMKSLCPFDIHEEDLLRRLFDEIYLGNVLYSKFTIKKPFFNFREGLIDKEERIPSTETLKRLKSRFGLFAMYSERPRNEGLYILQKHNLLDYFDSRAIFFSEDLIEVCKSVDQDLVWGKPHARAFVALIDMFCQESDTVAYVGDTVSDALMINNARDLTPRELLFIGTLSSSPKDRKLADRFMELGAEVIVKDANLIPTVFDKIGK